MISIKETGAIIAIIIALGQALKYAGFSSRFLPLVSVILGVVGGVVFGGTEWLSAASGVILGLTSAGLYDLGAKTVLNK